MDGLKKGFNHSFVNKHKGNRRNLALELESLAEKAETFVPDKEKEAFHEYLRKITNTLSMNVEHAKDNTFKSVKELRENHNITILTGDKDSSVVILDKADYQSVVQKLIDEGIESGKYVPTEDTILRDLTSFQSFLLRNLKNLKGYSFIRPSSNQPARFFETVKTNKYETSSVININNLKICPIIDQTGTCYYNLGKFLADYLKPLADINLLYPTRNPFLPS